MNIKNIKYTLEFNIEELLTIKNILEAAYKQANQVEDDMFKYAEVESIIIDLDHAL